MQQWKPHTLTTREVLEPGPVDALARLFDNGLRTPGVGDELPPLWHWVALPRWPVSAELGVDGHPARGSFLPPIDLPRRMFAGGAVTLHSALTVGEAVHRESTVESVTEKDGRSGRLVIVVVGTKLLHDNGELAVEERQDIVYREAGAAPRTSASVADAAGLRPVGGPFRRSGAWTWDFGTDPTLLMRFSAATANAHRIHYDWPYATGVEGYPGLVVHGPLMTLALAEVLRLEHPAARVRKLVHRNKAPLFCGEPAELHGRPAPEGVTVELFGPNGVDGGAHTSLTIELQQEGRTHA